MRSIHHWIILVGQENFHSWTVKKCWTNWVRKHVYAWASPKENRELNNWRLEFCYYYLLNVTFFLIFTYLCYIIKAKERKHLFVGIDTIISIGLQGPTNLFEHPTYKLLKDLELELILTSLLLNCYYWAIWKQL